jgi:undecaprenyl-diphosphatase
MTFLIAILLGVVQGVTEFLPVSSSGHLSILQNLFGLKYSAEDNLFFDVLLHIGTLVSVCVTFRKELREMVSDAAEFIRGRRDGEYDEAARMSPSVRKTLMVIIGTIPLVVISPFSGKLAPLYSKTWMIGVMLIITGALLAASSKLSLSGGKNDRTAAIRDAFMVGLAQVAALIPGLSRSGTTIAVGLARGFRRDFAVRFSLLLSIPAVFGAFIVTLFSALRQGIDVKLLPMYIVGAAVSTLVGLISIRALRNIVASGKTRGIMYYCWAAGAITLVLSLVL